MIKFMAIFLFQVAIQSSTVVCGSDNGFNQVICGSILTWLKNLSAQQDLAPTIERSSQAVQNASIQSMENYASLNPYAKSCTSEDGTYTYVIDLKHSCIPGSEERVLLSDNSVHTSVQSEAILTESELCELLSKRSLDNSVRILICSNYVDPPEPSPNVFFLETPPKLSDSHK